MSEGSSQIATFRNQNNYYLIYYYLINYLKTSKRRIFLLVFFSQLKVYFKKMSKKATQIFLSNVSKNPLIAEQKMFFSSPLIILALLKCF